MTRVTTKTVIIPRSFILNDADGDQPPGIYTVETEEDSLDGRSISAFRRVSTTLSRYDLRAKGRRTPEALACGITVLDR